MPPDDPPASSTELTPPYEIESLWCGGKDGMELSMWYYDKRFDVFAHTRNMEDCAAIKNHFLALAQKHEAMGNGYHAFVPNEPDPMEALCDWMAKPCYPQMRKLALHAPEPRTTTLEEYYAIPITYFILKVIDGKLTAVHSKKPYDPNPRARISERLLNAGVPFVHASQVEIPWDHSAEYGTEYFERETDILLKIQRSELGSEIRVPRLLGLVLSSSGKHNEISGILLSHIDCHLPLALQDMQDFDQTLRDKWCSQLKQMVDKLHKAGIIWGDVHANNVRVDEKNDIWIVNFGESYTLGWVDEKLRGTVEGDLQGLSKTIEFINGGNPKSGCYN